MVKYVFVFSNTQKLIFVFVSENFKSCIFVFEPCICCICIKYSQIHYTDLKRIADFNSLPPRAYLTKRLPHAERFRE